MPTYPGDNGAACPSMRVGPISKPDHFVDATVTRLQRRG